MILPPQGRTVLPIRIRYHTIEFENFDIHVRTLRDNQQFSDPQGVASDVGISSATWPFFGIIWESGEYLARLMEDFPVKGKRILEVGCGIGLPSLVLNHRGANITATDYHPEVGSFLKENTDLNKDPDISFVQTAWDDEVTNALDRYDIIIGSDLLYEDEHAKVLASFIHKHSQNKCLVVIVDPGRGHAVEFMSHMTGFGFNFDQKQYQVASGESEKYNGKILCCRRCRDMSGRN